MDASVYAGFFLDCFWVMGACEVAVGGRLGRLVEVYFNPFGRTVDVCFFSMGRVRFRSFSSSENIDRVVGLLLRGCNVPLKGAARITLIAGVLSTMNGVVRGERVVLGVPTGWSPEKNGCTTRGTTNAPREKLK